MQVFMNPYGLYDFMWGTTMQRSIRTTILAPPSGRNHYCFDMGWECKIYGYWGKWALEKNGRNFKGN